ncbi:unnamed protein product [Gongylonema pulchrum]|uniref:Uncharacterized protein n=1 Tax=Gongylonema pulchrum TaxID=637853 RepID=A0A183ERQ7_9BILA|nr:unnamed protein product [Gongylonema pulchrum]
MTALDLPTGVPPPVPSVPPPDDIEDGVESNLERSRWSSCTDSSGFMGINKPINSI